MYRRCAGKQPAPDVQRELLGCYQDVLAEFQQDPARANQVTQVGESKPEPSLDPAQLAAWTMVANLVLNLDEVINKN
jgi:hypothetical protein